MTLSDGTFYRYGFGPLGAETYMKLIPFYISRVPVYFKQEFGAFI